MRTSEEIAEELRKTRMSNPRRILQVELYWDGRIGFRTTNVDSLVAKMHELSLAYIVWDMVLYYSLGEQSYLTIFLGSAADGQTNIDAGFMEELSKLTIIPIGKEGQ